MENSFDRKKTIMALRTFYWNTRKVDIVRYYKNKWLMPKNMVFKYGNFGDIFNKDLIKFLYSEKPLSTKIEGNRLLLVGSIMNELKEQDIVNGIGWKGNDLSNKASIIESAKVYGVRGPLTKSLFEKYGADLSSLKFEYDPGLLVKEVYNLNLNNSEEKNVLFIPHYRDLWVYKGNYPKGIKVISVDNKPKTIAKEILKAKVVYASSLHGIIFSHALNKPCIFVKPQSEEPFFKYKDYFLSVGLNVPNPIENIHQINFKTDRSTCLDKNVGIKDFYFPEKESLKKAKIII